jgi:hypothetical protein
MKTKYPQQTIEPRTSLRISSGRFTTSQDGKKKDRRETRDANTYLIRDATEEAAAHAHAPLSEDSSSVVV